MSRQLRATRPGFRLADDTQRQIDYLPSMFGTYRKGGGDGIHSPKGALSFVGSFQGMLAVYERLTKSMIDLTEPAGSVAKTVYLLITAVDYDIFGNPINLREGDLVTDNHYSYLVDSIINHSFKNEVILEHLQ